MVTFLTIVVLTGGRCVLFFHICCIWMVAHLSVHGFISRLSRDKENRVPDKCSWRAVDRYGARRHRSSFCWKVSYPFFHVDGETCVCILFKLQTYHGQYLRLYILSNIFWSKLKVVKQWKCGHVSQSAVNAAVRPFSMMTNKSIFVI